MTHPFQENGSGVNGYQLQDCRRCVSTHYLIGAPEVGSGQIDICGGTELLIVSRDAGDPAVQAARTVLGDRARFVVAGEPPEAPRRTLRVRVISPSSGSSSLLRIRNRRICAPARSLSSPKEWLIRVISC